MTAPSDTPAVNRSFWIIGGIALVWNLMGVAAYLMDVTMSPEALEALPEAERALRDEFPSWITSAYAIAVFGGLLGCVLLLMRKALAVPVFIVSLIAILIQMGYSLFMSSVLEVRGATAAIFPLIVVAVGIYLVWYASSAKKKGLLV